MRPETVFRSSTYLSLALACLCLGYAEFPFLPEIVWFGAATTVLLFVAFLTEGRWSLSIPAANRLALVIAAGAAVWVVYHVAQGTDSWLKTTPWPAAGLPYLGPILLLLMAALVFRPKRSVEIWWLHGMGLMAVALGSSMADDSVFGLLLVVYVACALWSLAMFCLHREQFSAGSRQQAVGGNLASFSANLPTAHGLLPAVPWRWLGLGKAGRWTAVVLVIGILLFLCTPRHARTPWQLAIARTTSMQTGLPGAIVDLNRVGVVEVDEAPAFEVFAMDAHRQPKLDLDPQQRWRGMDAVFNEYYKGRWKATPPRPGRFDENLDSALRNRGNNLPDLGEGQFFLTFRLNFQEARQVYLAEPLLLRRGQPVPVVSIDDNDNPVPWQRTQGGGIHPAMPPVGGILHYQQVIRPLLEPGLSYPFDTDGIGSFDDHRKVDVPGIASWTQELLDRLVVEGTLAATDVDRDAGDPNWLHPRNHKNVARVLEAHLAHSNEFHYTLDLKRQDSSIDPTEDFLRNVKRGHCHRFATALALMLRTLGIPTRLIVGFRGCESQGDGNYVVRHSHAHAWVQAIIRREREGRETFHWLTLDPTPGQEAQPGSDTAGMNWWATFSSNTQKLWRSYVTEYNADQQSAAAAELWERLASATIANSVRDMASVLKGGLWGWPAYGVGLFGVGAVCLAGLWLVRRTRNGGGAKAARAAPVIAFYARLLKVLERRRGLRPLPPQTPREFAEAASTTLRTTLQTASLAFIPEKVVQLYYGVRYGDQRLTEPDRAAIEAGITHLDRVLAACPRPAGG